MNNPNEIATFAGGCFWCMEPQFAVIQGVKKVICGYTGGHLRNPTYEQVCRGGTGHIEAIEVSYDPTQINYQHLLDVFWKNIDPLDEYGQFCDKGVQYCAGIFTHNEEQEKLAIASREHIKDILGQNVATIIRAASRFYPAEDEHQAFYIKSHDHYKRYRKGCGRDERLKQIWGKS